MRKHHTFEEVEYGGAQVCLKVTSEYTHVRYRPATSLQPEEGGFYELDGVHVTSIETPAGIVVHRHGCNTQGWRQLDDIAAGLVENENEQYERDF